MVDYLVQVDGVSRFTLADGSGFILLVGGVAPPSPPAFDPNGVQGSGGGPPRKRRTLHLDERYRPTIVDPREYATPRKPALVRETPPTDDDAPLPGERPTTGAELPPLPIIARAPDGLEERVDTAIAVAERKRALAKLAADDEQAMLAIIFALLT
jgi:hypothetical protein